MKRIVKLQVLLFCLLVTLCLTGGITAMASPAPVWKTIDIAYHDYKIVIDSEPFQALDEDGGVIEPFSHEGRLYAPVQLVANALGMKASWDDTSHTLYLREESTAEAIPGLPVTEEQTSPEPVRAAISAAYGGYGIVIEGEPFQAVTADGIVIEPFSFKGWIFAPVEQTAAALGLYPYWHGDTRTLYLSSETLQDYSELLVSNSPYIDHVAPEAPTPNVSQENTTRVVYWVTSGEVYHRTSECQTLSRSKTILSGSVTQSNKPRPCKVCW